MPQDFIILHFYIHIIDLINRQQPHLTDMFPQTAEP